MIIIHGKGNYKKYSGKTTFRINLQKTTLSLRRPKSGLRIISIIKY